VGASRLPEPPRIDGSWSEWDTTQFPIPYLVFGRSDWSGEDDLRASYQVAWDADNLYLAVKVYDDRYVQNATGANLFKGDSIELLLSTKPDLSSAAVGMTANDFQIGISPGRPDVGEHLEAYLWYPQGKAGGLDKVDIGAVTMSGGYRIEAAIPWSTFGITPARGLVLGFAISVSDNDNRDKNVQQTMISIAAAAVDDLTTWVC
jgi:hypothetical protein